jgi:hypothetical protein
MGYLDNSGMLKYTNYERYSAILNFKLFNDKVEIWCSQFTMSDRDFVGNAPTPGLAITLANDSVYTASGDYGPLGSGYSDRNNPLLMQYLNRWDNSKKMAVCTVMFFTDIVKGLTF